mgnify:CR=1 FL=1
MTTYQKQKNYSLCTYHRYGVVLLLLVLTIFWSCANHPESLPEWGNHPPSDPDYWYGLGIGKTRDDARQRAIHEISSQISVTISSTLSAIKTEYNFNVNEFTRQVLETRVNSSLNNIELVNSHQSERSFYMLARLSKQKYYDEIDQKKNNAIQQAVKYLERAESEFTIQSFQYLDNALNEIEPFQDYPLMVEYPEKSGSVIMLRPYLFEMVINFSERLVCTFSETELTIHYGIPDPQKFFVDCVDKVTNATMEGIPLLFSSPENEFTEKVLTNPQGFSEVIINQILNKETNQYFRGEVNFKENLTYFPHRFNSIISTPLRINVIGTKVYFTGSEYNVGIWRENSIIESVLKEIFYQELMVQATYESDSDIIAQYSVETKQRSSQPESISGQLIYQAYAEMTLTLTDAETGDEIFQKTINNVKGVSFTAFEDAGMDALKNLKKKMSNEEIMDVSRFSY